MDATKKLKHSTIFVIGLFVLTTLIALPLLTGQKKYEAGHDLRQLMELEPGMSDEYWANNVLEMTELLMFANEDERYLRRREHRVENKMLVIECTESEHDAISQTIPRLMEIRRENVETED